MSRPSTCVIIPAHNEEAAVGHVVRGALAGGDAAVLVVDDGSTDGTHRAARRAGAHVLRLPSRRGKGIALRSGFDWARAAGFDIVVTMDGDGQHDPRDIGRLAVAGQWADFVVGVRRFESAPAPFWRQIGNRFSSALVSRLAARPLRDTQSGFRWMRRDLLDRLTLESAGFDIETELLLRAVWSGARIAEVGIAAHYDDPGSDFRPLRDSAVVLRRLARMASGRRSLRRTPAPSEARLKIGSDIVFLPPPPDFPYSDGGCSTAVSHQGLPLRGVAQPG